MLTALQGGARIDAAAAERGGRFACPSCRGEMILKRGAIRIAHFAHRPPVVCDWARGETSAHLQAKATLRDAFAARGLRVEVEWEVPALSGDRRADVMLWSPAGRRVAIELQHTGIGLPEIEARTRAYAEAGIAVLWVPFLRPQALGEAVERSAGEEGDRFVEKYPARPWELWVYGLGGGEVWLYDAIGQALWRGRFARHRMYAAPAAWYRRSGDEVRAGGRWRLSKRWRELTLWGPNDPADLRIRVLRRQRESIGAFDYPACEVALFTPAPAPTGATAPAGASRGSAAAGRNMKTER